MAAFDPATLDRWRALAIVDRDGTTVGTVSEFYLDRETGHPTWALVNTGLFGGSRTFVPLVDATEISDGLQVPYEKPHIKDAPHIDPHDELTPDEEATLFAHYGVDYRPSSPDADPAGSSPADPPTEGSPGALAGVPATEAAGSPETVTEAPNAEPGSSPGTATGAPATEPAGSPDEARPGSPEGIPTEPETTDPTIGDPSPDTVPTEPETTDPANANPSAGSTLAGPEATVPANPIPSADTALAQPEATVPVRGAPRAEASTGAGPAGPGTPEPAAGAPNLDPPPADPGNDEAWRVGSGRAGFEAGEDREGSTEAGADLSRPARVEPGLPGSTSTTPVGTTRTTLDPDAAADPPERPTEQPGTPDEADWAPTPGSFEEPERADRPVGSSDHWREAKLAAERDRIARTAAAQPEERSPLERAKRRLERLVGGGQAPADPEDPSATDRTRPDFDEDDRRRH